jgi:cell division protein FtsL
MHDSQPKVQLSKLLTGSEGTMSIYLAVVLVVVVIAIVNLALMFHAYRRVKDREPLLRDRLVGFLLAGPFFNFIDRDLRKRNHKLTRLEFFGLFAIALICLLIVAGSIVTNFSKYPI